MINFYYFCRPIFGSVAEGLGRALQKLAQRFESARSLKKSCHTLAGFFIFTLMEKIILASKSPRRKQLLEMAEIPFEVCVAETDETFPDNLSLYEIPQYIALQKALAVQQNNPGKIILAADTIVTIHNKIIGKPTDREDAINILSELSGYTHLVISGVVILAGEHKISFHEVTEVSFHKLTKDQIIHYVEKCKPFDKAGAYAIQEWIGAVGIGSINGDYYNVVGLPVSKVVKELQKLNL